MLDDDDPLSIYPSVSPKVAATMRIEFDPDKAFCDGIIAMADGQHVLSSDGTYGQAFHTGYQFADRWGERGKDLGLHLKYLREHAGEPCSFRIDPTQH